MSKRDLCFLGLFLWVSGCSSSSEDPAKACRANNPNAPAACNECMRTSCCEQMETCVAGSPCADCLTSRVLCTESSRTEVEAFGACIGSHCLDACGISAGGFPGTGGATTPTTGGFGPATGGSLGNGGSISAGGANAGGLPTGSGGAGAGGASGCPSPRQCGAACCDTDATCFDAGSGTLACATTCASSSDCAGSTACCVLLGDGSSVCADAAPDRLCRCETRSECGTDSCAPRLDTSGNPIGPYVCVGNDGAPYHGCHGVLTSCSGGFCCFTDTRANQFCAFPCQNDGQCGAAHCVAYDNANTTCAGTLGCGP